MEMSDEKEHTELEKCRKCRVCGEPTSPHRFVCEVCTRHNDSDERRQQKEEWGWYQALADEERRNSAGSGRHPAPTNDLLRAAMAECFAALSNWNYTEHITRLYLIALILRHRVKDFRQEFERAKGEAALRYWPPVPLPDFADLGTKDAGLEKPESQPKMLVEKRSLIDLAFEKRQSDG
jgi:hypothetical protein